MEATVSTVQFQLLVDINTMFRVTSLGSRRFPVRPARDRYMGSKVGGASFFARSSYF